MSPEPRQCQNCKSQFAIEPDDFQFYEKIKVPPPTFCPKCRLIRRSAWRNERTFHRNICSKCGKQIISVFAPESGLTVYCSPCWWSDAWDGLEYGVEYDPKKPFLAQARELLQKVPVMNLFGLYTTLVNSDYTNAVSYLKNCYYITHSDNNEDCLYGSFIDNSKSCVECLMLDKCELTYQSVNCRKCYKVLFSVDCESCHDLFFSRNCIGCSNCFGCVNLRNKQYHIFNEPHSKDGYEKKIKELMPLATSSIEATKKQCEEFWSRFPQKFMHERHNVKVTGDYIYNSKNTRDSYIVTDGEDCRFCSFVTPGGIKDSYDFSHYGTTSSRLYETLQCGSQAADIRFSWWVCINVSNCEYSIFLVNCENVFGSVGLKKKQYCILNKQYSKEDYEKLRARIIEDMNVHPYRDAQGNEYTYGEFFPIEMSPFGYNETTVQEFFPLTEVEAKAKGYEWRPPKEKNYQITVKPTDIPTSVKLVSDSISQEIIGCAHEGKCDEQCTIAFKIIPQELQFYKNMNLPLPNLCPNCRHYARLKWRNPITLTHRRCDCSGKHSQNSVYINTMKHFHGDQPCPNEFETAYARERPEIVYCEQCYQAEVV